MSNAWKLARAALENIISRFMPAQADHDQVHDQSDSLLVSIGLVTSVFSLLYVTVSYLIGFRVGTILMSTCFALLFIILAFFRATGRFRLCANLYLACCFFVAILGCSLYSGGIHSMVTPWFTLVPITSVLLLELGSDTIVWVALTCFVVFLYGIAAYLGFRFPMLYQTAYTDIFNMSCIVGLVLFLSLLAFIFGRNRVEAMAVIRDQKNSLERALRKIEHLAFYDALTQLPNRRLFIDRLGQALAESRRTGRYGALLFLDLDDFKPLNDVHGHEAGDLLLIEAAKRLIGCTREMDTVARFGGDEFAVILSMLDDDPEVARARASVVAGKISAVLAEPYVLVLSNGAWASGSIDYHCTASVGVVLFLDSEEDQDRILKRADEAMYFAKSIGKNAVHIYSANQGSGQSSVIAAS